MLIYNHEKEFVGIDESDLAILGYSNLKELQAEASDFADMFVKTPGFVHNFQHVSWIDFVACADSTEITKVIIHANEKNFRCSLDIKTVYLSKAPSSKAFLVYLNNIREILSSDINDLSEDLSIKSISTPTFEAPPKTFSNDKTPLPDQLLELTQTETFDKQSEPEKTILDSFDTPIDLDIPTEDNIPQEGIPYEEEPIEESLTIEIEEDDQREIREELHIHTEIFDNGYVFDPQVASDELGLPVDLIEEFIEDFIAQAKEFRNELYDSLNNGDMDNLKSLSHKLKGVAANLRVEDALESLTIINTSSNNEEILSHLDTLYKIMAKLSGKEVQVTSKTTDEVSQTIANTKIEVPQDETEELDIFTFPEKTSHDIVQDQISIEEDDETLAEPVEILETTQKDETQELDIFTFPDKSSHDIVQDQISIEEDDDDEAIQNAKVINYDPKIVASEIGLSEEHFREIFEDYLEEAKDISQAIENAIDTNEHSKWKNKAKQLKGISENMRVIDLTKDLDALIQTDDATTAKDAHIQLANSITAISKIEG